MPEPIDRRRLAQLGIGVFSDDIRTFGTDRLLAEFGSRSGRIVVARLARNLAWQAFERIRAGQEPPIEGNVRSFWYRFVKPVLLRIPPAQRPTREPDYRTNVALTELIEDERLFEYEQLGINDDNWRNRQIGLLRPHVLVFSEKNAHTRLLARAHHRLGVSFLSLGGAPSACTSEYTAKQMLAAVPRDNDGQMQPVHLVGLVDYDPAGAMIARSFRDQLEHFGLPTASMHLLLHPSEYAPDELKIARLALKPGPKTDEWLAAGGGIVGSPFGLSVESLPSRRIDALIKRKVLQLAAVALPLSKPTGVPIEELDARDCLVIRLADVGPSTVALTMTGTRVLIVDKGRVIAELAGVGR